MASTTQRHIIQTVYDKTGLAQYKVDMQKAGQTARMFGRQIAKNATFMGTTVKDSFAKVGKETVKVTQKTATFVQKGKQMKVTWRESAKGLDKFGVTMGKVSTGMGQFGAMMGKAMKRALIVAPVWLLLRSAMMLVIRTTRDMIKAYVDLEEGLARIRTVMHGTAGDINAEMVSIKRQIIDTAVDSRVSIKDLAEVMYFLKTASLTAEQAMSAFEHTVNAMTGTGVGAKEMARAVAGVFNTMGKYIDDASTDAEKFQKIADVLTYTFTKQDVEMGELIAGYTKLAPFLSGLDDSFTDIVTTLGFLNTHLLRAGRTGRLTGRAILQLTKNASKLASIFGISFDPDKPISFLKTIETISKAMSDTEKITFKQSEAIRQIFATRGGVAVKLLISHFDDLQEAIKLAGLEAEGFAEKIAEIKMGTISAQTQRMKNLFAILFEEFVSGVYGAGSLAEALKSINDSLKAMREPIRSTGELLGWFSMQTSAVAIAMTDLALLGRKTPGALKFIPGTTLLFNAKELFQTYKAMGLLKFESFEKYRENQITLRKEAKKEEKIREKIKDSEEETNDLAINRLAIEKESIKHQIALLKARGASALDIARYNLQALESTRDMMTDEDHNLELLKRENKVIQEQAKYRNTLQNKLISHELDLLQIQGLSGKELAEIKIALEEIILGRGNEARELQHVLDLEKAVTQEKLKQKGLSSESVKIWKIAKKHGVDTATNIALLLKGEIKRQDLSKKELSIFKSQFRALSDQMEAIEFFTKKQPFKPTGIGIPIREALTPEAQREAESKARSAIRRRELEFAPSISIAEAMKIKRFGKPIVELKPTIPVDIKQDIQLQLDPTQLGAKVAQEFKKMLDSAWERKFKKIVEKILDGWTPGK